MGSLTIWRQVYDNPTCNRAWADFWNHYHPPIYAWARRRVGPAAADDVTLAVFEKLSRRVRSARSDRVWPTNNSYQGFIFTVVRSAAMDYFREQKLLPDLGRRLSLDEIECLESPSAMDDLEGDVRLYASFEPQLAAFKAAYEAAVRKVKASRVYPNSFEVFLAIYRDGRVGYEIDRVRGFALGSSSKTAKRVWRDLIEFMGLPVGKPKDDKRSAAILQLMVTKHGDPS